MLRKLNATHTGGSSPANTRDYHIVFKDGQYRVFDKYGKFRVGFATLPAAQTYIASRRTQSHNLPEAANDGYNTHGLLVPLHELERIAAAVY